MSEGIPLGALVRTPGLVIRLGFSVLRMKRRVRKGSNRLRRTLIKNGMCPERARILAYKYEEGLSLRKLINTATGDSDFPQFSLLVR